MRIWHVRARGHARGLNEFLTFEGRGWEHLRGNRVSSPGREASLSTVTLVLIGLALLLLTGSAATGSDADPPYTVAGLNAESGGAPPGVPTFAGVPTAIRSGSVVLVSATLVPLPGFPLPHLVGVGLVPSKDWITGGEGWPVRDAPVGQGETAPLRPIAGYVLTAGHPVAIYYAFSGDRPGQTYYAGGIELTYRRGARGYTVTLWQIGADCVVSASATAPSECDLSQAATNDIEELPHP